MNHTSIDFLRLRDLAVLQATGADAVNFLHGQLTQDIEGLPAGQAALAGYCTAKGRLLGSLAIWKTSLQRDADTPVLRAIVKADLAQALAKRLSIFILRAKVQIQVLDLPVYGWVHGGPGAADTHYPPGLDHAIVAQLPSGTPAWSVVEAASDWEAIAAPHAQGNESRFWLIPADLQPGAGAAPEDDGETAGWQARDIAAGLPWIQAATQDVFIPQTLNFDLIGGVNFTKGCYPGQEVVARAHYRGTVKRRMAYGMVANAAGINAAGLAGTDTYDARHPDNPCGRIVNAAIDGETLHLLMEIQLADLGQADFRLESPDGPGIQLGDLPYEIVASEA